MKFRKCPLTAIKHLIAQFCADKIRALCFVRPGYACVAAALLLSGGCSTAEPWVKPYERQHLADPIMSFERDAVSTRYINHVYEAREAARGAEGSAGGGCGCN